MSDIPDFKTLEEAKQYLRERFEEGAKCPCCTQLVKAYKRKLYSTMAGHLINLYWKHENDPSKDYFHISEFCPKHPGDFAKFLYWGLVEEKSKDEEDKTKRTSGFWALTLEGRLFVENQAKVPSHVKIYDGKKLGFAGKMIGIQEALGKDFNYEELMTGQVS